MAFAGGLGARLFLNQVPNHIESNAAATAVLLFSESNTRFLCEVPPDHTAAFEAALAGVPCALVGEVVDTGRLEVIGLPQTGRDPETGESEEPRAPLVINAELATLKAAWQAPLNW